MTARVPEPKLIATKIAPQTLSEYELLYVYEEKPGITRIRRGRGFSYINIDGSRIHSKTERERLQKLGVPPTYVDVWYCPKENGHLQATGYDAKKKKQYFYHPHWAQLRESTKFSGMADFADALPKIRQFVSKTLNDNPDIENKEDIICAMVRILDRTGIRVGSKLATKTNKTYGLTTLLKKHVDIDKNCVHLEYTGKGGRELAKHLRDPAVATIIDRCEDIPGQRLFQYIDANGSAQEIGSVDINQFIKVHTDDRFSAKDFRTWRFSCIFLEAALNASKNGKAPSLKSLLESVSELSGNTPSILQSSYIHPGLIDIVKSKNWELLNRKTCKIRGLRHAEAKLSEYVRSRHATDALR